MLGVLISLSGLAWAGQPIYTLVNQTIPSGFTAIGTLETDGTTGILSAANFLSVDVTINDGVGGSFNFNNVGNIANVGGVFATASELSVGLNSFFALDENGSAGGGTSNSWQVGDSPSGPFIGIAVAGNDDFDGAWTGFPVFAQVPVIPEPSTYLLLAVGILAIFGMGYRRRKLAAQK